MVQVLAVMGQAEPGGEWSERVGRECDEGTGTCILLYVTTLNY